MGRILISRSLEAPSEFVGSNDDGRRKSADNDEVVDCVPNLRAARAVLNWAHNAAPNFEEP
jgi:hypothetical protein